MKLGAVFLLLLLSSCKVKEVIIDNLEIMRIHGEIGTILGYKDLKIRTDSCVYFPNEGELYFKGALIDYTTDVIFPDGFGFFIVRNGPLNDTVATVNVHEILEGRFKFGIDDTLVAVALSYTANYYQINALFKQDSLKTK